MIKQFSIFNSFSDRLVHGVTTKSLGSFNDKGCNFKNQLKQLKKWTEKEPVFSNQLHEDKVIIVEKLPQKSFHADAFITKQKNIPLGIKVADCQGILMFDPKTGSIAAIHSGWRGSALNIIGKTIQKMKEKFKTNPADLLVGIGPSLGPCCAKFSNPENELPEFFKPYIQNQKVDFWSLSIDQLKKAGVPENQIELIQECTQCRPGKYYSHRNADSGRMAVFISLK